MTEFQLYLYGPARGPISSSFEAAQQRLEQLPKLYFEPDGSFVWSRSGGREQVFGMLYDAAGTIRYCELRGRCSGTTWRTLCEAISGDRSAKLEIMLLPDQRLKDLQSFEASLDDG